VGGTGTVDPSLTAPEHPQSEGVPVLPILVAPDEAPDHLPEQRQSLFFRTDLPLAPGDNGAPRGTGRDLGQVRRVITVTPPQAETLYPIYQKKAFRKGGRISSRPVHVQIQIDEAGYVAMAQAVSGSTEDWNACVQAAKQWRFHVPTAMRDQAPFSWTIGFQPSSWVEEESPEDECAIPKVPKDTLYPLTRPSPVVEKPSRLQGLPGAVVRVEVKIDASGRVISAVRLSGPHSQQEACLRAARNWYFHVPAPLQNQAPFTWIIAFTEL